MMAKKAQGLRSVCFFILLVLWLPSIPMAEQIYKTFPQNQKYFAFFYKFVGWKQSNQSEDGQNCLKINAKSWFQPI